MDFKEKAKTVGVSLRRGSQKITPVRNEDNGALAGKQVEHWNDRVDAVVKPSTVSVALKVNGED